MTAYCPTCGAENRDTARFCMQCSVSMTAVPEKVCGNCGTKNPDMAKYCLNCATPLHGATPAAGLTGLLPLNFLLNGRYLIVKRLGKGGMGAVYQAADTRLTSKTWAIKEMSDAAILDPMEKQQAREAFQREAQMLALLDHVNLPKVNDFFTEGGKLYLVMDYIEGQTLQALLEARPDPFSEAQVVEWAGQLCDVLDYLHRCTPPIIFRDLKPGNIMIDTRNRVKLIDFGVARLFKSGQARDTANFGTAGYAPPEQYGKGQTDARSDVYALGVTLHELLTRYDPALTPFVLPPARNVNPAVSANIEQAVLKATQAAQTDRFQRAMEFKAALMTPVMAKPVIAPLPVAPQPVVTPSPVVPKPQPVVNQSPIAAPAMITLTSNGVEIIMIPAGRFLMGSNLALDTSADRDELPQRSVLLDPYRISRFPVTQEQYLQFLKDTGHRLPVGDRDVDRPYNWDTRTRQPPTDKLNHPVVLVSWDDASAYCQWLAQVTSLPFRLPTEAEWERAARGTQGHIHPWGSAKPAPNLLNFNKQVGGTTAVGKYSVGASPDGVMDMAGNVFEWVADWYNSDYYQQAPAANPKGPSTGASRVIRGGSWYSEAREVRTAFRDNERPDVRDVVIGFRVAYSI